MSIGFISPTFRVLELNWEHDYEMVKLGVPTIMGHLHRLGYEDLRHWDFDAQVCEACAADPAAFDLAQYFDRSVVAGFLAGTDDALRAQTEKLLDVLEVSERAVYGISLAAVLDRIANVEALAAVAQCLAKVIKERWPKSTIVIGGLQSSPDSTQPGIYRRVMEECPAVDLAFVGHVTAAMVQMFRNLLAGEPARNRLLGPKVIWRSDDGSVAPEGAESGPDAGIDDDIRGLASLRRDVPDHTNAGPSAEPPGGAEGPEHPYDTISAAVPVFDPALLEHFRYSGLQIMKRFHFDRETMLRFSRFENDRIVVLPHIFVRGCNASCGFCGYAYSKIEGEDVAQTVAGLRFLSETYGCRHFHFLNTQINSVYRYCERFCDALIAGKLDILWSDCCNMRALDERLLEKMRLAGAVRLVFGVESPEDSMLRMIHKGVDTAKIERLLRASHELGIWNHVLLIAGMPHETKEKQDRIMAFLERTAPAVDFYSVSAYYLISSSPWGREPEKYGIERISDPSRLLEEQAFNEVPGGRWESEGLRWEEKKRQIVESTQRTYRTLTRAKGQSRCVAGNIDLYLLMFLYSALGHEGKEEIRRLYARTAEAIFPGQRTEGTVPRNGFRVKVPWVLPRVNEADQLALVEIPVDVDVHPHAAGKKGFAASPRYTFGWRSPALDALDDRLTARTRSGLSENLPKIAGKLTGILGPFLKALDTRLAPATPDRMAELAALNLPRYGPFANEGYTVTGPQAPRTSMDRTLEWSGLGH